MGIGKTHFPNNSNKAIRGDYRVGFFNTMKASAVDGEGIKTVCGISADYRCRFKFIVGVCFFKSKEGTELFVFTFILFRADKFFVCFLKLFFKFLVFKIKFFCVCKTVKKILNGICYRRTCF